MVSKDVVLPDGNVLLKQKQTLTIDMITQLIKHAVMSVEIVDKSDDLVDTLSEVSFSAEAQKIPDIPVAPNITIFVREDVMSASLVVEPAGALSKEISFEQLKAALTEKGVVSGIDEHALRGVVETWHEHKRRIEIERIARGTSPEPAREGAVHVKVRPLTGSADIEKVQIAQHYWQVADSIMKAQRVTPGTILAEKQFTRQSVPGRNIKGEPVLTDEIIRCEVKTDKGVDVSSDGEKFISTVTGICYFANDTLGVLEINFNGSVDLVISSNKMDAQLVVHPAGEGGSMPSEDEIYKLIFENRISYGIKKEVIRELVANFAKGKIPKEPVIIAEGDLPQNGRNGSIEFLFNTETSLTPKQNSDGSVDYKSVNIINSVAKGQKLARLIQPTKGTGGKNIFEEKVPALDGTAVKLPLGPNTEIDPQNAEEMTALVDGVVRFTGTVIEISEGFVIPGNVDFSTGHVKYEKSVIVNGDIKSGFNVECGGDLQVGGTVEDCRISVGGNFLCKYGFIGQGKGLIEAKGDVNLSFSKNQTVKSRKSVNIAKEVLNCNIFARNSIVIHGNPLSAAGGCLTARDSITLYSVGNHTGIRTILEIGLDFTLMEELEKIEEHYRELAEKYSKLVDTSKKYEHAAAQKKALSEKERELMNNLNASMAEYKQQMDVLDGRKKIINTKLYQLEGAFIKIEHSAMPGTLIKFGERHFLVKEEVIGPKNIRMVDHEIRVL